MNFENEPQYSYFKIGFKAHLFLFLWIFAKKKHICSLKTVKIGIFWPYFV